MSLGSHQLGAISRVCDAARDVADERDLELLDAVVEEGLRLQRRPGPLADVDRTGKWYRDAQHGGRYIRVIRRCRDADRFGAFDLGPDLTGDYTTGWWYEERNVDGAQTDLATAEFDTPNCLGEELAYGDLPWVEAAA